MVAWGPFVHWLSLIIIFNFDLYIEHTEINKREYQKIKPGCVLEKEQPNSMGFNHHVYFHFLVVVTINTIGFVIELILDTVNTTHVNMTMEYASINIQIIKMIPLGIQESVLDSVKM